MAASGSEPAAARPRLDPVRLSRRVRRFSLLVGVVMGTWFLLQFGGRWVPRGMDTVASIPPGSWCIVDRWSTGLRVGSDVFVTAPHGELLTRVAELRAADVVVENPNPESHWPDSRTFGPLPRSAVLATVMVVFPAEPQRAARSRGR